MKELLQQYAAYNVWANQQLTERVLKLPEAQQVQNIPNSFPSLHLTILHLWDAGSIWWQRHRLQEAVVRPSEQFKGNTRDAVSGLLHQDRLWETWINNASLAALEHVFAYQNTRKEHFKQPVYQMLLHVFNHSTYHRGQIVTMLRQLGADKIPNTDFIGWSRTNARNVKS
jgi:uncharacterized damage-inducible protein DinB